MRTYFYSFLLSLASLLLVNGQEKEYRLQKDDTVKMVVFQEPELLTQSQIGKSGYVSFPLIGNIKLIGKSLKEAEDEIKASYERDFLVNAQVNLSIVNYAQKWVIVGGDVRSPGTISFPEEGALDLRGAIAQAGGALESANTARIVVRSKSGAISTYSLKNSGSRVLKHGDTLTVPRETLERSTVTFSGQVSRPGVVEYPKAGKLDIMTALAQAGGFNRIAYKKSVVVHRNQKQILVEVRAIEQGKAKMFFLEPGDLIVVRESRL